MVHGSPMKTHFSALVSAFQNTFAKVSSNINLVTAGLSHRYFENSLCRRASSHSPVTNLIFHANAGEIRTYLSILVVLLWHLSYDVLEFSCEGIFCNVYIAGP